jgi:HD-GYP domain-containing protein (c-di-GMP phosphodiesterase class II)
VDRRPTKEALTKDKLEQLLNVRITPYKDTSSFSAELKAADSVYSDYEVMVTRFYGDLKREQKVDMKSVRQSMGNIVDSVIRNPDAIMLLARLKRKSDYAYNHALGSSIWAAAMGRKLGLPKHVLISVASGAMLLDVGKINISDRLLNKVGPITGEERILMQSHVHKGLEILKNSTGVDRIALDMVRTHHERHNGKGYPNGLKGADIPVYGRIAGIVDSYDALINSTPYRQAIAPSEAIKLLYNVRNVDFQKELVEIFIQALGVYPAGSLVELTTGAVGVVVGEHRHRRLRPKVVLMLDENKNPLAERKEIDLNTEGEEDQVPKVEVMRSLQPGEYGINPDDILI